MAAISLAMPSFSPILGLQPADADVRARELLFGIDRGSSAEARQLLHQRDELVLRDAPLERDSFDVVIAEPANELRHARAHLGHRGVSDDHVGADDPDDERGLLMMQLSKDRDQALHVPRDQRMVGRIELRGSHAGRDAAKQVLVERDAGGVISSSDLSQLGLRRSAHAPRSACGRLAQRLDGCRRADQPERPCRRGTRPARSQGRPPVAVFERVLQGLDRLRRVRGPERIDRARVEGSELAPDRVA